MLSIAAITQRIDQYFCNLANHHFYICTIWCVYFYHLLSFLFKNVIRIPCPYFLFWFFLNWPIIVDMLEKKNNRTQTHGRRMCFSCIQVDNFRHVCHRGSIFFFFCTKMSKTRDPEVFGCIFKRGQMPRLQHQC